MTAPGKKTFSVSIDSKTFMLVLIGAMQLVNTWTNYKIQQGVQTVHVATNSMKDALVKASRAEGRVEGRAQQKAEDNDPK